MSFIALTGGGVGGAYQPGDKWGAQTAEKVRGNFNDHETRVVDLETATAAASIAGLTDVGLTSPLSDGELLTYDSGSGLWLNTAPAVVPLATGVSGDLPLSNLAQGTALSVLGVAGNATADEASIVAASDGQVLRRSGTSVGFGAVDLTSANAITGALPLANLPTNFAQIFKATPTALTDAQIKALPTTPITLIAAPSSGTRIRVLGASLRSLFSAGGYTNIDATYAALAIYHLGDFTVWPLNGIVKDTSAPTATRFTTMFSANDFVTDLGPYLDVPDYTVPPGLQWALPGLMPYATVNGTAIAIKIDNNGTGNLASGNSANTLKVTLYYTVEAL